MFETATLSYGPPSKRVWTTFAGVTGQALLVTCALLAPLVSPQMLPRATWITTITAPGPPPPPPPGPAFQPKTMRPSVARAFHDGVLTAPRLIPPQALMIEDPAPELAGGPGVPGGVAGGREGGVPGGILNSILNEARPAAPVAHAPEPVAKAVPAPPVVARPPRISAIEMARPIHRVEPVYPPLARQMLLAGVVELQGVLGIDGRIHELKVLSGHPMLVKAAVDAVLQWTYAPTVLNGQPVEVVAPIQVTFRLSN